MVHTGTFIFPLRALGSWCARRPVAHQRTSVLPGFNCSLLDFIQAATAAMHSLTVWTGVGGAAGAVDLAVVGVEMRRQSEAVDDGSQIFGVQNK